MHRFLLICSLIIWLPMASTASAQSSSLQEQIDQIGANVIFMRHALAPGTGDPSSFRLEDCSTQRNLDERGRQQARALGQYFRDQNVLPTKILSSGWCRCYQTAELLDLGGYEIHPGLHSFFNGYVDRNQTLALLNEELETLGSEDLVLMVTHQVVITSTTGVFPASGALVLHNTQTGESLSMNPVPAR